MKAATKFETLMSSNLPYLKRAALSYTHDQVSAEDLVQETTLRIWSNREKFAMGTSFKSWSLVIMRNLFINEYRKQKRRGAKLMIQEGVFQYRESRNEGEGHLVYEDIMTELNALSDMYSRPVELFYEGYSYKEIAEMLDISIGTVKSRIFFARSFLKERLASLA